ncbi:hypothetical protein KC332_g18835 [Hortaea werneckii]|nr:hypothetical protein KC350_g19009 [Hortaea werneckii]KAI6786911.1 hypothetical protein KC358_g18960 [Hortaea werneckii]KAI6892812.1 hypothetical protein KC348_g18878 [Hortaea werneckii]KAI6916607.1 hypothetical protein KC341_g18965 [Hortaea werneckii]KAI6948153.1 hypothetical protein KC321_g18924 [Hortaea werneckii]
MRREGLSGRPKEKVEDGYGEEIPSSLCPLDIGDDPNEEDCREPDEDDFDVSSPEEDSDDDMDDHRHPIVGDVVTRLRRQKTERLTWIGREGRPEGEVSGVYLAYGNEAELSTRYSSAALVVKIPSWMERRAGGVVGVSGGGGTRENPVVL